MLKLSLLLLSLFSFSCNCQKQNENLRQAEKIAQQEFPFSEIYYQSWVAGVRGGGSGINVHIIFKNELPTDVKLVKVQLLHYTSHTVDNVEGSKYIARIATEANQMKLEESPTDEYGNQAPMKKESSLKEGEVLLTFEKKC
ncbi:MAG: hypothetical protein IE891_11450 [Flavobacteriaceae bacterium]|nr:hypothetical protein [Flavobacteriaceae bacterium]